MRGPYYRRSASAIDALGSWSDFLHGAESWLGKISNAAGRVAAGAEQVQNTADSAQAQLPNAYTVVKNPRASAFGARTAATTSQFVSDHPVLSAGAALGAAWGLWHFLHRRRA